MKVMKFVVHFLTYWKQLIRSYFERLTQNGITDKSLNIFDDFLRYRKQRVVPNGETSNWEIIHVGLPQGSILRPLLFLIYINDLSENLSSNPKPFANDTFLLSVVRDLDISANGTADDLKMYWGLGSSMRNAFQSRSFDARTKSYIFTKKK